MVLRTVHTIVAAVLSAQVGRIGRGVEEALHRCGAHLQAPLGSEDGRGIARLMRLEVRKGSP